MRKTKTKQPTIFFIVAFTLAIFTFSIGNSALTAQKEKFAKLDSNKNKSIVLKTSQKITKDKLLDVVKDKNISIQLEKIIVLGNSEDNYFITTEIKHDGFSRLDDLRYGSYLSIEDYQSNEPIGVFSTALTKENNFEIKYTKNALQTINISEKGRTFGTEKTIDVSNNNFFDIMGNPNFASQDFSIVLSGNKTEIEEAIKEIENYILSIDKDGIVDVYNVDFSDMRLVGSEMFKISIIIVIITIINSISISALWVKRSKKELTIRKVCGGTNYNLAAIFFKKLIIISLVSALIAVILQIAISNIFNGVFLNLDIRPRVDNIIYSFVLSIGVSLIATIPAFSYISKIQPVEMLRED